MVDLTAIGPNAHALASVGYIMPIIPESHADLLDKPVFWHIATTGPSGDLQSTPVWAGWDGDFLRFSLTKGRQKYRNLQNNSSNAFIDSMG